MKIARDSATRAFSLVELLCVIVVIGILAGLLLTAVMAAYGRVKRMQRQFEGPTFIEQIRERLTSFCEGQPAYPALTPRQFHELGVFDGRIMDFLRARGVKFHPFASSDPTNKIVLEVLYSKKHMQVLLKSDLRRPEE
ncbi:MAG: type II secretion system GspH family protein [Verrucomicrobiales bacterium]|nr:type II secretion system GspH family protein [Verrucomicrobiales bacterium]